MNNLSDAPRSATLSNRLHEAANARARLQREVTHDVVVATDPFLEGFGADIEDLSADTTGSAHALVAIRVGSAAVHDVSTLYISDPEPRSAWWRRSNPTDSGEVASPVGCPGGHSVGVDSLAPVDGVGDSVEVVDVTTTEHGRSGHDVTEQTIRPGAQGGMGADSHVAFRPRGPEPLRPLRDLALDLGIIEPMRGDGRLPSVHV